MGARVAQALNYPMVNDYLSLGHGVYVVEIRLPPMKQSSTVETLITGFDSSISCLLIKRKDNLIKSPPLTCEVAEADVVLLCGSRESLIRIAPRFNR